MNFEFLNLGLMDLMFSRFTVWNGNRASEQLDYSIFSKVLLGKFIWTAIQSSNPMHPSEPPTDISKR